MRIPGLVEVYHLPATSLPARLELMADVSADLFADLGASIQPLHVKEGATFDIAESWPNNSYQEKVTVNFTTNGRINVPHGSCLVVSFADGSAKLVGTKEHQPTIEATDNVTTPDGKTACSWSAELTAKKAAIEVVASTFIFDEAEVSVIGEMQEVTEAAIDTMINNLE